jgi:hypothetical protein
MIRFLFLLCCILWNPSRVPMFGYQYNPEVLPLLICFLLCKGFACPPPLSSPQQFDCCIQRSDASAVCIALILFLYIHLIVPTSSPDEDKLTKLPLTVSPELTVIKISPLVPDHGDPIDCYVRFILFEMVAPPQQENVWNSVGCRPHLLTHTNCSAKPEQ